MIFTDIHQIVSNTEGQPDKLDKIIALLEAQNKLLQQLVEAVSPPITGIGVMENPPTPR